MMVHPSEGGVAAAAAAAAPAAANAPQNPQRACSEERKKDNANGNQKANDTKRKESIGLLHRTIVKDQFR